MPKAPNAMTTCHSQIQPLAGGSVSPPAGPGQSPGGGQGSRGFAFYNTKNGLSMCFSFELQKKKTVFTSWII